VRSQSHRSGTFAVLALAAALSGCANTDVFDSNERWFSRPFDWTGRNGGYTFSELQESNERRRPVTATDLVDANGACPPAPVATAPSPAPAQGPGAMPTADAAPSLLGQGVELGMTECQVIYRAGAATSVQLGNKPNGDRTAVLTYNSGPRPGIYRFERGRLIDMDRVDVPAPALPKAAKRAVKKKKKQASANPEQVSIK
jgi:hypothetical protein